MDKPWMTKDVKTTIRRRNRLYNRFKRSRLPIHEEAWKHAAIEANFFMNQARNAHKEKIKSLLMDPNTGSKKYWMIAKQVYGSKKSMSIPALMVNNKNITTSSEKAKHFTEYFAT